MARYDAMLVALRSGLSARVHRRELLFELVIRNLKVKYQRSMFGFLWTLAQPILMLLVLISVFTYVVRIDIERYWAFLVSGYFLWNFLQQCLNAASYVFAEHANVIRSISVPKATLLHGAVLSRLVEFLLEVFIVLVVLSIAHHQGVPTSYVFLPLLVILQAMLATGLSAPIALLSAFYRDIQHALPLVLMILFYVSPIFYPISLVPEHLQSFYQYNPISQILELYHTVLYEGEFPQATDFAKAMFTSTFILVAGSYFFNRYKAVLPEIV